MAPVEAAEDILRLRPFHVVGHEQVQMAVAIVIEPQRGRAEAVVSTQMASLGHVGKSAMSVVLKQPALPDGGNKQIGKPVVVEIADRHAHPVHLDIQPRAVRDVGKRAVVIVAVKGHACVGLG